MSYIHYFPYYTEIHIAHVLSKQYILGHSSVITGELLWFPVTSVYLSREPTTADPVVGRKPLTLDFHLTMLQTPPVWNSSITIANVLYLATENTIDRQGFLCRDFYLSNFCQVTFSSLEQTDVNLDTYYSVFKNSACLIFVSVGHRWNIFKEENFQIYVTLKLNYQ